MSKDLGDFNQHSKEDLVEYIVALRAEIERLQADLDAANKREAKDYLDLLGRYEGERVHNVRATNRIAELERENAGLKAALNIDNKPQNADLQDAIGHLQNALDEAVNLKIDLVKGKAFKDADR